MPKNIASCTMPFCADAAVRMLVCMGYARGTRAERIRREVKVNMIGAGSEEILTGMAARRREP